MFLNLCPHQIRGFYRKDTYLHVFFFADPNLTLGYRSQEAKCTDNEKAKQLLGIGTGSFIQLFNVKVTPTGHVLITAKSGIRELPKHVDVTAAATEERDNSKLLQQPNNSRWTCLICNFLNFSSISACYSCKMARRQGPVGPSSFFNHLRGPPYVNEPWSCDSCFAQKNSPWNDSCWKCGKDRPKKKQRIHNSDTNNEHKQE